MSAQTTPIGTDPPRSCANCQYWFVSAQDKKQGSCFFNPPVGVPAQGAPGLDGKPSIGMMQIRPPTHASDFCHEHTREGEMHASEALVAAVADLIEPIGELRDYLKQLVSTIGTIKQG